MLKNRLPVDPKLAKQLLFLYSKWWVLLLLLFVLLVLVYYVGLMDGVEQGVNHAFNSPFCKIPAGAVIR